MGTGPLTGITDTYVRSDKPVSTEWNTLIDFVENLAGVLLQRLVENGIITQSPASLTVDEATARLVPPGTGTTVVGVIGGQPIVMTSAMEVDGTATGGSTTTLDATGLTQASGYWAGAWIEFTSGVNSGLSRKVTGFAAETHRLSWTTALDVAVTAGDTFTVTFYHVDAKTDSALNYIFARATSRTAPMATVEFYANVTGITDGANDILLATMTLDGSGVVTLSDNAPEGCGRTLYRGVGSWHTEVVSGTVEGVPSAGSVEVTVAHEYLLLRGGIEFTLSNDEFEVSDVQNWKPDEVVFVLTNNSSYTYDCDYDVAISGRQRLYL